MVKRQSGHDKKTGRENPVVKFNSDTAAVKDNIGMEQL